MKSGIWKEATNKDGPYKFYVPKPLQKITPLIREHKDSLAPLQEKAVLAVGALNNIHHIIPNISLLANNFILREVTLSSQIEGTQSSVADVLKAKTRKRTKLSTQIKEVTNHQESLEYGLQWLKKDKPICNRLLRDMQKKLLTGVRGSGRNLGEFRQSQNWIGSDKAQDAEFVPPAHNYIQQCMGDLERFINEERNLPVLIKTALAHVQFETIHPFLDGNGRTGRMLIVMMMNEGKLLNVPILHLSLYFKNNREDYYECLQRCRLQDAWGDWLRFFLNAVLDTAQHVKKMAEDMKSLFENDRKKITHSFKGTSSPLEVFDCFVEEPWLDIKSIEKKVSVSVPTIYKIVKQMKELKILHEVTVPSKNKKVGAVYLYDKYVSLLNEGTEI